MTKIIDSKLYVIIKFLISNIFIYSAYLSFEWWFCNKAVSDSKDTRFISHSKNNLTESKPLNNRV